MDRIDTEAAPSGGRARRRVQQTNICTSLPPGRINLWKPSSAKSITETQISSFFQSPKLSLLCMNCFARDSGDAQSQCGEQTMRPQIERERERLAKRRTAPIIAKRDTRNAPFAYFILDLLWASCGNATRGIFVGFEVPLIQVFLN